MTLAMVGGYLGPSAIFSLSMAAPRPSGFHGKRVAEEDVLVINRRAHRVGSGLECLRESQVSLGLRQDRVVFAQNVDGTWRARTSAYRQSAASSAARAASGEGGFCFHTELKRLGDCRVIFGFRLRRGQEPCGVIGQFRQALGKRLEARDRGWIMSWRPARPHRPSDRPCASGAAFRDR